MPGLHDTGRSAIVLAAALLLVAQNARAQPAPDPAMAEKIETCGACHGADGNSRIENIPSLAGQPVIFTETQLIFFRERLRRSEQMSPQAEGLTDRQIGVLAAHFASLPPRPEPGPAHAARLARGKELATGMRCGTCHLPDYTGRQQMPRLAGQREDYLVMTLTAYRDETRGGPDTTMIDIMRGATDEDIAALAHFLAQQGS